MEGRSRRLRRAFALAAPRRRDVLAAAGALALLPTLVAVAAAQPVIVREQSLTERVDAQAFFLFDTTLSMSARSARGAPTRLERAVREAEQILPALGDIPVGVATMTDRVLPDLMPTANNGLVLRTLQQSVGIDRPPPSQLYPGRVPNLQALLPIASSHLFTPGVRHPILVIFTDGETTTLPAGVSYALAQQLTMPPLFVHVWAPSERIYVRGRLDPNYRPDPSSGRLLRTFAHLAHGQVFGEHNPAGLVRAIHAQAGTNPARTDVSSYARVALAPWILLAGVIPLAYLFWSRNS
jgi:hypothetical protein